VTPPGPPQRENATAGFAVGAIVTMVVGAVVSIVGFAALLFGPGSDKVPCAQAYGESGVLLVIALLSGALAWYMFFRNKSRGFGAGFLRGMAIGALLVVLVPWPCSYPMAAYGHLATCTH